MFQKSQAKTAPRRALSMFSYHTRKSRSVLTLIAAQRGWKRERFVQVRQRSLMYIISDVSRNIRIIVLTSNKSSAMIKILITIFWLKWTDSGLVSSSFTLSAFGKGVATYEAWRQMTTWCTCRWLQGFQPPLLSLEVRFSTSIRVV